MRPTHSPTARHAVLRATTSALLTFSLLSQTSPLWAADTPEANAESNPAPLCADARLIKTVMLTRVALPAPPPDVLHLGAALAERVADHLRATGSFRILLTDPTTSHTLEPAVDAFARRGAPYFIRLSGRDFGVSGQSSAFALMGPSIHPRGGSLTLSIGAGMTAEPVLNAVLSAAPSSGELFTPPIDARGAAFWQSPYGQALDSLAEQAADKIADSLRCTPLIGSVVAVNGDSLTINRGSEDGLRFSDTARILARSDPLNGLGQAMLPERFTFHRVADASIRQLQRHTAQLHAQGGTVQVGDVVWVGQ